MCDKWGKLNINQECQHKKCAENKNLNKNCKNNFEKKSKKNLAAKWKQKHWNEPENQKIRSDNAEKFEWSATLSQSWLLLRALLYINFKVSASLTLIGKIFCEKN